MHPAPQCTPGTPTNSHRTEAETPDRTHEEHTSYITLAYVAHPRRTPSGLSPPPSPHRRGPDVARQAGSSCGVRKPSHGAPEGWVAGSAQIGRTIRRTACPPRLPGRRPFPHRRVIIPPPPPCLTPPKPRSRTPVNDLHGNLRYGRQRRLRPHAKLWAASGGLLASSLCLLSPTRPSDRELHDAGPIAQLVCRIVTRHKRPRTAGRHQRNDPLCGRWHLS